MAEKTLLFKTDAGKELNVAQVLEPRVKQAEALGAKTVEELPVRILARDKDGNLVADPILTDMLNTDFVTVLRHDMDGKEGNGMFVTFATTSNAENGGIDPEKSLLVSLNDLIVNVNVPATITASVTSETLTGDPLCKYYGKPILLDAEDPMEAQWKLISERTVRLHKNNGQSVGGKWELDLEAIDRRTPDVLHLSASAESEYLSIALDPSKIQTIPVIFTPEDGQDQFKLVLFINPFDQRPMQKQMKISNSTAEPAEAQFLRPWVIAGTVDDTTLTGAKGEGGALKIAGLTNCVKAVDAEAGTNVVVTVTVTPEVAAFNTTGTLDAVKIPSVPKAFDSETQLKNLVEEGLFTVEAVVSATGYESQTIRLSVCINAADGRDDRMVLVIPEDLDLSAILANNTSEAGEVNTTTRHNEDDELTVAALGTAVADAGIAGKDGETDVEVTASLVDENGASANKLFVVSGDNGEPSGYVLVKCEATGYVTETIKLPVAITDKRLADEPVRWIITWTSEPTVTIAATEEGANGDAIDLVVSSLGKEGAAVATVGEIATLKDQWGNEETVVDSVVGVVDARHPLTPDTVDEVSIEASATTCWMNLSILTESGLLINKRVVADVTDSRE